MSIAENLALAAYRGKPRRLGWPLRKHLLSQLRDRVSQLNMGLEDRLKNPIGSLSGGQRQALTRLMATWLRPEVLLLEEHTGALDPKSADQVIPLSATIIRCDKLNTLSLARSIEHSIPDGRLTGSWETPPALLFGVRQLATGRRCP